MMYLAGGYELAVDARLRDDVGYMLEPRMGRRICLSWVPFAVDNGCFSTTYPFNLGWWLRDLQYIARRYLGQCLFVVAPDVVGHAAATLSRSLVTLPLIRRLGFRAAYVTQDGQPDAPIPWDMFDVLFVGGSNAWKDSEQSWAVCAEAKQRGKLIHIGRVNGWARMAECKRRGIVDSVDGTKLNYHPTKMWDPRRLIIHRRAQFAAQRAIASRLSPLSLHALGTLRDVLPTMVTLRMLDAEGGIEFSHDLALRDGEQFDHIAAGQIHRRDLGVGRPPTQVTVVEGQVRELDEHMPARRARDDDLIPHRVEGDLATHETLGRLAACELRVLVLGRPRRFSAHHDGRERVRAAHDGECVVLRQRRSPVGQPVAVIVDRAAAVPTTLRVRAGHGVPVWAVARRDVEVNVVGAHFVAPCVIGLMNITRSRRCCQPVSRGVRETRRAAHGVPGNMNTGRTRRSGYSDNVSCQQPCEPFLAGNLRGHIEVPITESGMGFSGPEHNLYKIGCALWA